MTDFLQSLILQIALNWIEQEKKEIEAAKETYMAEQCPAPDLSGDQAALMVRDKNGVSALSTFRLFLFTCMKLFFNKRT